MFLIPAIDLKDGRCVRLVQGAMESAKTYYSDPLDAAKFLVDAGADLLHVVDLDGAVSGNRVNRAAIEKLARLGAKIQVGGGIRTFADVDALLSAGIDRVVIGTTAATNPDAVFDWIRKRPDKICVGLDARDGIVAVKGWNESASVGVAELARRFDVPELAAIIHTDISRDGMQTGVNIDAVRSLARIVSVPVIASGGAASIGEIERLAAAPEGNIAGVISGRAIYEGNIDVRKALTIRKKAN